MDNRGIDTDPGWINRQLRELRQAIESLRSERRAGATGVSSGDFTVSGGGSVYLRDGGALRVMHAGGAPAITVINQALLALTPLGATRLQLSLHADALTPDTFSVLGMGTVSMFSDTGSGVTVGGASGYAFRGVRITAGAGENVYLVDLPTTSNSANLTIDATSGLVARSTSSRKYKQDIADHDIDPTAVLKMRPRTWRDRSEVKRDDTCQRRHVGFIAEELHDLGLTEFVTYDDDDRPDAIAYDRLSVALLAVLKSQQKQIDDLAAKVAALTPPTTPTLRST